MYCFITYDNDYHRISEAQYKKLEKQIVDPSRRTILVGGVGIFAINNLKYIGREDKAPKIRSKGFVPAEQKKIEEKPIGIVPFLETGKAWNIKKQRDETEEQFEARCKRFRTIVKKVFDGHVARKDENEKKMRGKQREAHETWVKIARVKEDDPARYPRRLYWNEPTKNDQI